MVTKKEKTVKSEKMSKGNTDINPKYYEIDGVKFLSNPTMDEFLAECGYKTTSTITKLKNSLKKVDIIHPSHLFPLTISELSNIDGISDSKAIKLYEHAQRLRRKGNLVLNYQEIEKRESEFKYISTASSELDEMLTYSNGEFGLRSRTMIELYGTASSGKTQICLTAACMVMRPKDQGGWDQGVAYIDSEGSFELRRFKRMARYWGVDPKNLENKLLYSRAINFDDVETALDTIGKQIEDKDIGIVIIDSIMDPLKSQYPVGGSELSNLQPRQKHLKRVLDKLKRMAEMYNLVTIYTNHIRANISTGMSAGPAEDPQGGAVIAHASDIRILLDKPTSEQRKKRLDDKDAKDTGLKIARARIVDCGFLPNRVGFFLIGPMGVADPKMSDLIVNHTKLINSKGYVCINSHGVELEPLEDDIINRENKFSQFSNWLYGNKITAK